MGGTRETAIAATAPGQVTGRWCLHHGAAAAASATRSFGRIPQVWLAAQGGCHFLLGSANAAKVKKPLLVRRLNAGVQQAFVVLGSNKSWVAVLLQQQHVNVLRGRVEGEPRWVFQAPEHALHGLAVNVYLARCSRL